MATRTVRASLKIDGVLTDATTAKLSDSTGSYGVKRNDTDAVVVADGTAMTWESTGVYTSTFTSVDGVAYTAYVEFVYGGNTYRKTIVFDATTSLTEDLTVTYSTLRREVGRFLGHGHDITDWESDSEVTADITDIIRSGMRRVLTPPPLPGEKKAHEWSFLRPVATLTTTAPYTTGTVTVVAGVATISGGSWPSWATQGMLAISGGTYSVASVSGADLTLTDTTVTAAAGTTFSLGRIAYTLPSDFAMIDGPLVYAAGQSMLRSEVVRVSEHMALIELCSELLTGYPRKYAIRPRPIDMTTSTTYEMLLTPTPDAAYSLYYHYRIAVPLVDGTNAVPPGGDAHGELYLEACLAAAEQKFHDGAGLHSARFMECLAASVAHDRAAACPDTLGFSRDRSDDMIAFDPDDHFFTCTGLTRYKGVYPP